MTGSARVIRGDSLALPIPDASVDLVVTSPPYFNLRSYTDRGQHYPGQIGDEDSPGARRLVTEARYNGRQAREIGAWLYVATDLPESAKAGVYREHVSTHTPRWERTAERRAHVFELLASGKTISATASESGVAVRTIFRWKKERTA